MFDNLLEAAGRRWKATDPKERGRSSQAGLASNTQMQESSLIMAKVYSIWDIRQVSPHYDTAIVFKSIQNVISLQ